jgi:hypothetical protein
MSYLVKSLSPPLCTRAKEVYDTMYKYYKEWWHREILRVDTRSETIRFTEYLYNKTVEKNEDDNLMVPTSKHNTKQSRVKLIEEERRHERGAHYLRFALVECNDRKRRQATTIWSEQIPLQSAQRAHHLTAGCHLRFSFCHPPTLY